MIFDIKIPDIKRLDNMSNIVIKIALKENLSMTNIEKGIIKESTIARVWYFALMHFIFIKPYMIGINNNKIIISIFMIHII